MEYTCTKKNHCLSEIEPLLDTLYSCLLIPAVLSLQQSLITFTEKALSLSDFPGFAHLEKMLPSFTLSIKITLSSSSDLPDHLKLVSLLPSPNWSFSKRSFSQVLEVYNPVICRFC